MTETRNEAAERVRAFIDESPAWSDVIWQHEGREHFEEALQTERRITVEWIRVQIEALPSAPDAWWRGGVNRILEIAMRQGAEGEAA